MCEMGMALPSLSGELRKLVNVVGHHTEQPEDEVITLSEQGLSSEQLIDPNARTEQSRSNKTFNGL